MRSNTTVTSSPVADAYRSNSSTNLRIAPSGSFHHRFGRDPITFMPSTTHRAGMSASSSAFAIVSDGTIFDLPRVIQGVARSPAHEIPRCPQGAGAPLGPDLQIDVGRVWHRGPAMVAFPPDRNKNR